MKPADDPRNIRPAASLQTESTAASSSYSSDDDDHRRRPHDDEDSFTGLVARRRHRRRVQFSFPPSYRDAEAWDGALPSVDPVRLWYSKHEVALHRRDVQRTIRMLRKHAHGRPGNSARVLVTASNEGTEGAAGGGDPLHREGSDDGSDSDREPPSDGDNAVCFRGCERYHSLETRYMAQKLVVDAVLEAQAERRRGAGNDANRDPGDALRRASEEISQPGKELAVWHATLNAFHCYGMSGLVLEDPKPLEGAAGSSATSRKRLEQHEPATRHRANNNKGAGSVEDKVLRQPKHQHQQRRNGPSDLTTPPPKQRGTKPLSRGTFDTRVTV